MSKLLAQGEDVVAIPGRSRWLSLHEARMTRAALAASAPAPEIIDEVTLEGRFGIVLTRLDGPTLQQLSRSGARMATVGAFPIRHRLLYRSGRRRMHRRIEQCSGVPHE